MAVSPRASPQLPPFYVPFYVPLYVSFYVSFYVPFRKGVEMRGQETCSGIVFGVVWGGGMERSMGSGSVASCMQLALSQSGS